VTVSGRGDAGAPGHPGEEVEDRSLIELLSLLSEDARVLIRREAELAKLELREKGRAAASGVALFAGAAIVGLLAAGALTACAVLAIALVLPAWAAALIVAVVAGLVGALLARQGRDRLRSAMPLVPERAIGSVREDIEWAKRQTRSATRSPQPASE
jgi:MFS family permease